MAGTGGRLTLSVEGTGIDDLCTVLRDALAGMPEDRLAAFRAEWAALAADNRVAVVAAGGRRTLTADPHPDVLDLCRRYGIGEVSP